jgi:type I restriction-modification system DNA methylase subunit
MRTTEQIRIDLGVSGATISNWVKTGVIPPYPNGRFFDDSMYHSVIETIKIDHNKLQKRANRSNNTTISVNTSTISNIKTKIAVEKLAEIYRNIGCSLDEFMYGLSINLLIDKNLINLVADNIQTINPEFTIFLNSWKPEKNSIVELILEKIKIFDFLENETDFLGSTYESLRTMGDKAAFGAFFTPKELVADILIPTDSSVLDPCAGTGTMLLGILDKKHNPKRITIRDVDTLALKIAMVNFILFFDRIDVLVNTEIKDIIFDDNEKPLIDLFNSEDLTEKFDFVITNPPYGVSFSIEQKKHLQSKYVVLKSTESFSITLLNCLKKVNKKGKMYFILPESFLYVDAHLPIRKAVFNTVGKKKISYFGNAFKGIVSKIIRLDIDKNSTIEDIEIINKSISYSISRAILEKNEFRTPFLTHSIEKIILSHILELPTISLIGKCKFGLGIVTGNNEFHLLKEKTATSEPIFTGKELNEFQFDKCVNFIKFNPNNLQQVAPEHLYRQPKICYRFISDSIIMTADFEQSLILNSVNFFIPDSTFSIKSLVCFFNASIVTFIYQKCFNSTKVLKNHIENMPIPLKLKERELELEQLYDLKMAGNEISEDLDLLVGQMFELNPKEIEYIKSNFKKWKF